jgi:hypothetical protein
VKASAAKDQVYELGALPAQGGVTRYAIIPQQDVDAWGDGIGPSQDEPRPDLVPACEAVASACIAQQGQLGRAAASKLRAELSDALLWTREHYEPERGAFVHFAHAVSSVAVRRFREAFTPARLRLELVEERLRARAFASETGLVQYLAAVRKVLEQLARRSAQRFRVDGSLDGDLIDECELRLLELFRGGDPLIFRPYERPGRAAFVQVYEQMRGRARRLKRLYVVMPITDAIFRRWAPSAEEILLEEERRQVCARGVKQLKKNLTCRQQQWLEAFEKEVWGKEHGLRARAAAQMGVDKSQATRAAEHIAKAARALKLDDF